MRGRAVRAESMNPQILVSDLVIGESPRWHDDRLWFCHWGTDEIVAVDLDGNCPTAGC